MSKILVINPNSSVSMTQSIDRCLDGLRKAVAHDIVCATLTSGPEVIESQADVERVVIPTVEMMKAEPADAYVIACYSDPGLALAREEIDVPVLGIAESSMLMALNLGYRFGIVAIAQGSIRRHLRTCRSLGLEGRLAADRSLDLGVHGSGDNSAIDRIVTVGRQLRDEDGADVVILACAGMGHHRERIEDALKIPVVDPCQAAVARAGNLLALGYRKAA